MSTNQSNWIPEILYEESEEGLTSKIPFIQVPDGEEMPSVLFMFESRDTGEFEPGLDGEEVPVTELDLYQYANMNTLKERLTWVEYDNVRFALGLEPMKTAAIKGQKITSNVRVAVSEDNTGNALNSLINDDL
jgi:hypothetical protein